MRTDCGREAELLEALTAGQWPDAGDPDVRLHVSTCGGCADLVQVVLALSADQADAARRAPVPSAAIVWWRAQLRTRQEAARAVSRPITVVQGLTLASALALCGATAGAAVAFFRGTLPAIDDVVSSAKALVPASPLETLTTPLGLSIALFTALWLIGAPLAVYLACADD